MVTSREQEALNVLDAIREHSCRSRAAGGVYGMRVSVADRTFYARAINRLINSGRIVVYGRSDDCADWYYRPTE